MMISAIGALWICVGLLAIIFVGSFVYIYVYQRKINKYLATVPSPPYIPLIGHIADIPKFRTILEVLYHYSNNYGDFLRIQVGPFYAGMVVSNYKFVEWALSSNKLTSKSDLGYSFLKPWLGTGLLISSGEKWHRHRKLITPSFHFKIIEGYVEVFEIAGNILIERLNEKLDSSGFDIFPMISMCTLDIICETAMGTKVNAQMNSDSSYIRSVKDMCQIQIQRCASPLKMWDSLFRFTSDFKVQKKALNVLHTYTYNVIDARQGLLSSTRTQATEQPATDEWGRKRKHDFLESLLKANETDNLLSLQDIREEVDTFMFEGHDTTSAAICFAVYSLATNPEVQDKAFQEQATLFGNNKNSLVGYQDLQNMKYLELVIKETLRLYPSVPFYGRQTTEDLEFEGQTIPAGIDIMLFAFAIHRNPNYFPNPDQFRPERFLEMGEEKLPFSYIPFSAGPRNCIGQKFAMLELKCTLSKIIRNFRIWPSIPEQELVLEAETILKSTTGVNVRLTAR